MKGPATAETRSYAWNWGERSRGETNGGSGPNLLDTPVGLVVLLDPAAQEGRPVALRIKRGQLALEVGVIKGLEGVVGVELAVEGEEPVVTQPIVNHLDDLAAAVVGQAEK